MELYKHAELTEAVINVFYHVYNTLGYGFLEKVYRNAMIVELQKRGHQVQQNVEIAIRYEGVVVGEYYAELIVDSLVLLELKAAEKIAPEHEAQILNYLKATNIEVGLILNFGPKPEIKRKVFDNSRKPQSNQSK